MRVKIMCSYIRRLLQALECDILAQNMRVEASHKAVAAVIAAKNDHLQTEQAKFRQRAAIMSSIKHTTVTKNQSNGKPTIR